MLRSNCRKAVENIRAYIMENFDCSNYDEYRDVDTSDWAQVQETLIHCFYNERLKHDNQYKAHRIGKQELFFDWCQGLPSILDTCYYYNRSAVDDLANILEETDAEKKRFTESQAEEKLTWLIYREVFK